MLLISVTIVDDAHEALYMLKIRSYDLVISDVHMPGINGIELLQQIDEEFHLPVISKPYINYTHICALYISVLN